MRKFLAPLLLILAGCVAPSQVPPPAPPAVPPGAQPPATAALPSEVWEIVGSALEVRVFRDGPMAKLAHNHLITSHALTGRIELRDPRTASGFQLELPLESLVVDDEKARQAAGGDFAVAVPEKDRAGTRQNLLGSKMLDAALQAVVRLTADGISGGPEQFTARVRVGLRGEERVIEVPVTVAQDGAVLRVHAKLGLRHADLGLVPFTAGLGAVRVRDDFEIDCRLEARRAK
jgi:hypothetical protein